ncbi:unnamed protein product [Soboliphyme baturini]|uniref:CC domain-containing protein n=1 Tax=Soboliphyme baturini TaxID=241478 RepID=A0A183IJA6_9BILA|nr:unnamed protein product [Soboliphyme baturini]
MYYKEVQNGNLVACVPGPLQACPPQYTCQLTTTGDRYLCCPTSVVAGTCPDGSSPLTQNGNTVACLPTVPNSCPAGYGCQLVKQSYVCCRSAVVIGTCPSGLQPFIVNGIPLACTPGSVVACPLGFTCQPSTNGVGYLCCSGTVDPGICPNGIPPYSINGNVVRCNGLGLGGCPAGFTCQISTKGLPVCCPSVNPINPVGREYAKFYELM